MVKDEHASRYIGILANRLRREIDALSFRRQYSGTEGKALHFILAHEDSELFQKDLEDRLLRGISEQNQAQWLDITKKMIENL